MGVAMTLARHSDPKLTMAVYNRQAPDHLRGAVDGLAVVDAPSMPAG